MKLLKNRSSDRKTFWFNTITALIISASCATAYASDSTSCSGTIIDNFRFGPLAGFSGASSVGIDSEGSLYVGGTAYLNNISHWVVRKSLDNGANWAVVDDFQYQPGARTKEDIYPQFGSDKNGGIYEVAFGWDTNGKSHWIVRKTADKGHTWSTVDDFQLKRGSDARATDFSSDSKGNLYVSGYAYGKQGVYWVVRKSIDGGTSWSTIDTFQNTPGVSGQAYSINVDVANNLFVVGTVGQHWLVRKSSNQGTSWSTVDDFQNEGRYSVATSVTSDTSGNTYVLGTNGIVRKGSDEGMTWTTVDAGYGALTKNVITADVNGNIYAAGMSPVNTQNGHWIVKKTSDQGLTWSTIQDFQLKQGSDSLPRGITTDANGNVFSVGMGGDRAGGHWLTYKLSCE